jgi:prepilin-type N-terminal cleavage/methylation domain-containing protein
MFTRPRSYHVRSAGVLAFTLIEIMIVVGIIGVLIAIAVPGWIRQRSISQARVCQQNLRSIDEAKEMCALAESYESGHVLVWDDIYTPNNIQHSFLKNRPVCPTGGSYILHPVGTFPECSLGGTLLLDGSDAAQHRIAEAQGSGS